MNGNVADTNSFPPRYSYENGATLLLEKID